MSKFKHEVFERFGIHQTRVDEISSDIVEIVKTSGKKNEGFYTCRIVGEIMDKYTGAEQMLALYTLGFVLGNYMAMTSRKV